MKLVSEHKEPFALAQLQGSRYPLPNMAPIPPFVARVTETHRGVELHTKHGHELLTVSSRTKKANTDQLQTCCSIRRTQVKQ